MASSYGVPMDLFLSELMNENTEMQKATTYRQATAQMALEVAEHVGDPMSFSTREYAYNTLKSYFKNADEERLLDVSKFLNVIYTQLQSLMNLPENVRLQLEERKKMRGEVKLQLCV